MRRRSHILACAAALAALALGLLGITAAVQAQSETTVLGNLISRALSTPTTRVTIGAVDGALSSDATIRNVTIADRDGPWLRLDRARLIWRRAALFSRRLEVDRLEIGRLEVLRRPLPSTDAPPPSDEPLLPELPVRIEVKAFSLAELALGEPVAGVAARLSATGSTRLGPPSEGLGLTLDARRLDAAGRFAARLGFVPQGERLDLRLDLDEPAGGLLARLANLPGLPPVRLDLQGQGVLDDWRATLAFTAGPEIGANGDARIVQAGADRRLTLNLASRIEGLLPAFVAPVFSGTTRLAGDVALRGGGAVETQGVELASQTASLLVKGSLSADQVLDVTATARALPTSGTVTRAGGVEIASLVFDGRANGAVAAPRVTGRLAAAGISAPQGRLGRLQADLAIEPLPAPADPNAARRFTIRADAQAEGVAPTDEGLARALGGRAEIAVNGAWGTDGAGEAEILRVATPTFEASYRGRLGAGAVDGTLDAGAPDLSAFARLVDLAWAGEASLQARLGGRPGERVSADLDATARRLRTGLPAADRALGGALAIKGRADLVGDGIGFSDLRVEGERVALRLDGSATRAAADLRASLALTDLARLDERLAGRADAAARLTGSLARPDITASVTTGEGTRALGRPLRDFRAEVNARDVTGALDAGLNLSGAIGDEPLRGQARLRRADGWSLDRLELRVGTADIAGRAALDPGGLAEGSLTVRAPDLDSLSPLLLTKLAGSLDASLTLVRADRRQDARLVASGRSLRLPAVELAGLDADLSVADLYGRLSLNGRLDAERLVAGGETFESVRLAATGSAAASDITLAARARGFALEGAARLLPDDRATRVEVASLSAQRSGRRIALVQPASVMLEGGTATIAGLVVAAESGRITLSGQVGERLALDLGVRALPLSALDILRPGLGLSGTLDGEATLSGSTAAPHGPFRLTLARGVAPATRSAGLAPIDATLRGELAGESATIEGDLRAGAPVQLRATGRVPLDAAGPLSVSVTGRADAAVANAALGTTGQRLTGRIAIDGRVTGTLTAPRLDGSATLAEGTFTDPLQGIRLTGLRGRVSGSGDTLTVEELSAATRNGGTLAVRGRVEIAPDSGWPGQLRIQASRAELLASDVMTLVTDLNLDLSGPLARTPRVAGRVGIVTLDVSIPDQLPVNVKPLPGARHIAPPPAVRARLAAQAKAQAERRRAGPPFNATLDLAIAAPNRIFVRGRGVDAELGGDLRLTGTSRDPVAIGAFDLRRGRITLIGQQIDFTRGRLTFAGDLTPDLDLVAETSAGDVTARIAVSGPADRPAFDLSSEPSLPQDEVLSRLLFQKASGNLSGFQALQLAQAVSQLSGGAAGIDVFDRARRSLGLDSLDLTTGSGGGVAVGASRYISDRVSVGVRAGANPEDSAATVNIDVTRRLRVQGEAGADGRTSIGVGAEWEY